MKVSELIEELQKYPSDMEVRVANPDNACDYIPRLELMEDYQRPNVYETIKAQCLIIDCDYTEK